MQAAQSGISDNFIFFFRNLVVKYIQTTNDCLQELEALCPRLLAQDNWTVDVKCAILSFIPNTIKVGKTGNK